MPVPASPRASTQRSRRWAPAGRASFSCSSTSVAWNARGAWPGISNGSTFADTGYQSSWEASRAQAGKQGLLVVFSGGDTAGALAPGRAFGDADGDPLIRSYARAALKQMEPVLPGISAHWNGRATLSVPTMDPNTRLSYAYWRPGQYTSFAGYEHVRQGNIHFAGEHCSVNFQGYMEGGAETGLWAANEILADL